MSLRRVLVRGAVLVAAAWLPPAQAHLVETGFGGFYDGVAHLAMSPSDLLVVLAIALLAGQGGARTARWVLFTLPLAWLAGVAVGAAVGPALPAGLAGPWATTLSFGIAGALVALRAPLPAEAVAGLALVAGLVHGHANGAAIAPGGANLLFAAGAAGAAFCLLALVSAQVSALRAGWPAVAVRVAGSWVAAASVLMLGWLLRAPA